jgi:hypothetical protein
MQMREGICAFGDCFAQMLGFAVIGLALGLGGAYLYGKYGKRERALPEPEPAVAGLGQMRRRARKMRGR